MKIRSGFVSNSSSSSFVIRAHEPIYGKDGKFQKHKCLLTKSQLKALEKFGFFKTLAHSPAQVECRREEVEKTRLWIVSENYENYNYGYDVTCNQDEVFQFLLENEISFVADEHYGHRTIFYDSKSDKVVVAQNFGTMMSMYGVNENMDVSNPVQTFTQKQYLKKVSW